MRRAQISKDAWLCTLSSPIALSQSTKMLSCACANSSGLGTEGCLPCLHLLQEISPMWDKFSNTAVKKLSRNLLAKWIVLIFFT